MVQHYKISQMLKRDGNMEEHTLYIVFHKQVLITMNFSSVRQYLIPRNNCKTHESSKILEETRECATSTAIPMLRVYYTPDAYHVKEFEICNIAHYNC